MKKDEILDIAKQLILISGKYSKVTDQKQKNKIIKIFDKYEAELLGDKTKYSQTILTFLYDLKDDLESGRELNIDNLKTDEYLENYLLIKRELKIYNSLILEKSYRIVFEQLGKNKIDTKLIDHELLKLDENFLVQSKKINTKLIAKNLLIFTSFQRIIPRKYLFNLYQFLKNKKHKQLILNLINIGNKQIVEVKQYGIENYKTGKINYKYIGFSNTNGKTVLNDKIVDCSKINHRTGFVKKEYLKLIKAL